MRLLLLATVGLTLAGQPPSSTETPAPPAPHPETLRYDEDLAQRMTVPVTIGGRGPYRFVVDTGAERTVLSQEVASSLGLIDSGDVTLTSITDVLSVPTVSVPQLSVGRRSVRDVRAPILSEENLGAHGLLGTDSLQNMRVDLDFEKGEMYITRLRLAQGRPGDGSMIVRGGDGTIVVTGRTLLGRMILTDATVDGQRVRVVVDTGSAVTIGNSALRERLARRHRDMPSQPIEVTSVTGGTMRMDYTRTGQVRIGGAHLLNFPIGFADVRLFRELNLHDEPAMLLGMDALRLFRQVSIDFATRRLRLVPGPSSFGQPNVRFAASQAAAFPRSRSR
jgi:predicted aspartyl protease